MAVMVHILHMDQYSYLDIGMNGYGWCMQQGANVTNKPTSYYNMYGSDIGSHIKAGASNKNKFNWLCENMVAYTTDTTELNYYKAYWKEYYGVDFSNYSMPQIFTAEQYVLWYYTNGISMSPGSSTTSERYKVISLANKIRDVVDKNVGNNYSWISTPQSKVSISAGSYNGATKVATFKVNNAIKLDITSGSGTIYTDSACTKKYTNGTFIKSGTVYVKVNSGSEIQIKATGYKTKSAYYYNCGSNQPVFTLKKQPDEKSAKLSITISGSYSINIIKKDQTSTTAVTDPTGALSGASFHVERYLNSNGNTTGTPNTQTITTQYGQSSPILGGTINITSTSADRYQIREETAPTGYTKQLSDSNGAELNWTIGLQVFKKIEGTTYKIDHVRFLGAGLSANGTDISPGNTLKVKKDGTIQTTGNSTDYMIAISLDISNNITVVWKDPKIKPITVKVVKKSSDGSTVTGAKFSLLKGSQYLMNNTTINSSGYSVDVEKGNTYSFDFYETYAPDGYINIFNSKGYSTNTKIKFDVKIGTNGVPTLVKNSSTGRTYSVYTLNSSNGGGKIWTKFYDNVQVALKNREITITITDPRDVTQFDVRLNKYEKGNESKAVAGAEFSVKEIDKDGKQIKDLGTKISNTTTAGVLIDSKTNIELGTTHTYYYEVVETNAPENYTKPEASGLRFKVTVDAKGNVSYTVTDVYANSKKSWYNISNINSGDSVASWNSYISLGNDNKTVKVKFLDDLQYHFELNKKNYANGVTLSEAEDFDGSATFKIEKIYPESEKKVVFEGQLKNAKAAFSELSAKSDATYKYRITETGVSSEYYDTLVNKPIIVTIRTDNNGKIKSSSTTGCSWEFDSTLNLTNAQKTALKNFVDLKIESNNKINFYIANMPKNYYGVQLIKIDGNGDIIDNVESEFYVRQTSTNSSNSGYTLGTENQGVSTTKGILNISSKNVIEPGYTHTYTIKETKAPAGYIKLGGHVELDVKFTESGELQQNNITYRYINSAGTVESLDGLNVVYNTETGIPMVQIYIPNDSTQFEFELQKQDLEGNLIKAETKSNGNIDGAIFNIQRINIYGNPNASQESMNELSKLFGATTVLNDVLENGVTSDKLPLYSGLTYVYSINEIESKSDYVNAFKKYQFILSITASEEDGKPIISSADYSVIDISNHGVNVTEGFKSRYGSYIDLKIDSDINKVTMIIKNTPGYKVRLNKTDTSGNAIDNAAIIEAYKDNERICLLDGTTSTAISDESIIINKNEEQTYRIYERAAISPYYNIFGDDKYIEVKVRMNAQGIMEVVSYIIKYNNTNEEVPANESNKLKQYIDKIEFIKEDETSVLNVVIKDPKKYRIQLEKCETDGETELSGATLSINGTNVISNGTSSYQEDVVELGETRQYKITEEDTVVNHTNILEGKYILLTTQLLDDDINYNYDIYYSGNNQKVSETDEVYNNVSVFQSTDEDNVKKINIKISNPGKIRFELTKTDTANNKLSNVLFTVTSPLVKSQKGEYIDEISKEGVVSIDSEKGEINCKTTSEGKFSFEEMNMITGTYEYAISETYIQAPYVKIFEDYKIFVKVTMNENGEISLEKYSNGKNFEIRDESGNKAPDSYYEYVKQVYIDSSSNIQCVKIEVQNPVEYKIKINKQIFGENEENLNLAGTVFEVTTPNGIQELTTDDYGNITIAEGPMKEGTYEYTIKEKSVPSNDIVNILSDNSIKLKLYVSGDGTVYTLDSSDNKTKNSYFIYDKNDRNVNFSSTKIDDYVNVEVSDDEINVVNVKILDPQKYDIKITKKDSKSNEYLNDVRFDVKVLDSNGTEIKLKDANTLEDKDLSGLITKSVNDVDGVIEIKDILFEKTGTYELVLTEAELEAYKPIDDIHIKYTVDISNKKYTLQNFVAEGNNNVIDADITKIIHATDSGVDTLQIPVINTPINGEYSIQLQKVDGDSNPIEGIIFSVVSNQVRNANRTNIPTDDNGILDITNGNVSIVYDQKENLENNESKVSTTDIYTIEEVEAGNKYQKLKNKISITVNKEVINKEYQVSQIIVKEQNTNNSVTIDSIPNTAILSNVQLESGEETVNLTIGVDSESRIYITVPNIEQYGEYEIELIKKKNDGKTILSNIPFNINDVRKETDANGSIKVTKDKSTDNSGIVKITKDNVDTPDTYKIEEIYDDTYTKDYVILGAPITLTVNKGLNNTEDGYEVKNVVITHTMTKGTSATVATAGKTVTFYTLMSDGTNKLMSLTFDSSGKITLNLVNPEKSGKYSFQIEKVYLDENEQEHVLNGVSFNIVKNSNKIGTIVTGDAGDGYTDKVTSDISVDNVDTTDYYSITENTVESEEGIVKLKYSLLLTVTKRINNNKDGYTLNTVKLEELSRNNSTPEIKVEEGKTTTVTLNGVELQDGRTVDIDLNIDTNSNLVIKVRNRKANGNYTIKIEKLDEATKEPLGGVTFGGLDYRQIGITATTATSGQEKGIATIASNDNVNSARSYNYVIWESEVPDGYLLLSDYQLLLTFKTKLNDKKTEYVVDKDSITLVPSQRFGSETAEIQKEIIEKTTFDVENNTIILHVYNRETTDYDISLNKFDMETNEAITDAKFTIKENGKTILEEQKLSELSEDALNKKNIPASQTFKYEIYETEAALGYDNIFVTNMYSTHLVVTITIDIFGNATANYDVVVDSGNRTVAYNTVMSLMRVYSMNTHTEVLVKNGNSFTLNIPNPASTVDIDVNLNKHQLESTKGVDGAVFGIRRIHVERETGVNLSNIINQFTQGTNVTDLNDITTSTSITDLKIDSLKGVRVGDSYYFELYEKTVPDNFISQYEKAILRLHVNTDSSINANIVAILPTRGDDWVTYDTSAHGSRISASVDGTNVKVSWSNEVFYMVQLFKKQYEDSIPKNTDGTIKWTGMQELPGASFTLKQISPIEQTIWNNEIINGSKVFYNEEANTGTTYKYEIIETASRDGFYNLFEGMKIYLYVRVDNNGKIVKSANDTKLEIVGGSSTTAEALKLAKESIGIEVEDNKVDVYIANKQIKNTFDISIMKVADILFDGQLKGVEGVEFSIMGPNQLPIYNPETNSNYITDSDGNINIPGLEIKGGRQDYIFTEVSVPDGVTKLENTAIVLTVDTTDISPSDSPEEIAKKISQPKADGTSRVSIKASATGAGGINSLDGLNVEVKGTTILVSIPNPTSSYTFGLYKKDPIGNLIYSSDGNGAADFRIITPTDNTKLLLDGPLSEGRIYEHVITKSNTTYEYKIEETNSKPGFVNVLEGWELHLYIKTDANGRVKETIDDGIRGETYYRLVAKENEKQRYTWDEIISNKYIKLTTNIGDRKATIDLNVINPYEYKVQLNKKDLDGTTSVDKANIIAERVDGARIKDLYMAGVSSSGRYSKETVSTILKEIVTSTSVSKTANLDKKSIVTSDGIEIDNNIGIAPTDEAGQVWRISETDVSAPYTNILENKYIVVQTYYREGALHIASHQDEVDGVVQTFDYYITDKDGNDLTLNYSKYVDASVKQIDGEWTLVVTIKDPMKFYVDLNKVENDDNMTPLEGAQLELKGTAETITTEGKSYTDQISEEIAIGRTVGFSITEKSTTNGHINVLENKRLIFIVRNDNGNISILTTILIDTTNGNQIIGTEKQEVMQYITWEKYTNDDGYTSFHVYVKNPIEFKFNLQKLDTSGELLEGAQIRVVSSHSGRHYLDKKSSMEITETGLAIGDVVYYNITEEHTVENSAYVNVFKDKTLTVVVKVQDDGSLRIIQAVTAQNTGHGSDLVDIKTLGFVDYNTSGPDSEGVYTVNLIMENPTQVDFELVKKSAGSNSIRIENTKFTVDSSFSGTHEEYTDENGDITFRESPMKAGEYEYKITEDEVADANYVNILEGLYIKEYIKVLADGTISFNQEKVGKTNPYRVFYQSDDTEVTDSIILSRIYKYVSVGIDTSGNAQKLVTTIKDPVTIDLDVYKTEVDGTAIPGTNFTIESELTGTTTKDTNEDDGNISINEGIVDPGVYRYTITENNTAGAQYYNVLKDCRIVIYVKVSETGLVTFVSDENGTNFSSKTQYQYYIEKLDGSEVDAETEELIHKHISINSTNITNGNDGFIVSVENTVNYKLDIIKTDTDGEVLSGTKFTVYRDNKQLLNNADIITEPEVIEENMEDGSYEYFITENSSEKGHINILEGKFIKVYTTLKSDGTVAVMDPEDYKKSPNYFEIYQGTITNRNNATLLDKDEYSDLYSKVSVESIKGSNGIYTLNVKVENPERNVRITLNKKIFGNEKLNLANTEFTIISEFSGNHTLTTDAEGNLSFEENQIPVGTYKYLITETKTAGDEFVNILDNMYIVVWLKVNQDGTIEIVDENGKTSEGTYYLYKGRQNSTLIDKVEFNDTVVDNYIRAGTTKKDDMSEINIYVSDPEFYNFELIKKDRDTNDKMNGVTFTLNVYNEDDEKVELKDAVTLEKIVGNTVTTRNVNGIDGVISIPNILIEKSGIYTYVFHEESTDGIFDCLYKSLATDIRVDVKIVVDDSKKYAVESTSITQGNKYVETVSTSTTKAQTSSLTILNERIKGSYDLILNKLDSYTKEKLNGAEFNVTVQKDEKSYELYKATNDVTSKDIIIPAVYTVDNGKLTIPNIRIDRPETYTITLTETKAPKGYMLLDQPIEIEITTGISGTNDDAEYILESVKLKSGNNYGLVTLNNDSKSITVNAKNEYFDLSLRKSITSVEYDDGSDDGKITEDETKDRIPDVITTDLLANKDTTADYNHVKNHVRAYTSQEVIYTLRVYNEGEIDGYAEEITDHLPEGLEFVNDNFNAERGWTLDANDPTLRTVKTTYLSKENNPNNDKYNSEKNLIKAMDKVTGELDYKEIQIKCKISDNVKAKTVLTNIAEISISKANNRTSETVDRDSVTNNVKVPETSEEMSQYQENNLTDNRNDYVPGQEDDDDFEKLIVEEFDLALRKYIVAVNDEELLKNNEENTEDKTNSTNGSDTIYEREPIVNVDSLKDGSSTTATYTHTKEPVEVSVGDIVTYTLEVYNEGTVSGYASLIKDDIPEGLEFVTYTEGDGSTNDIYRWKMVDENDNEVTDPAKAKYVVSDYLSKANEVSENSNLINAYDPATMSTVDSKYVRVAFRVVCKQDYPKVIKNEAQISEDSDESGRPVKDRDSTPNEWLGEDDEDVEYVRVTYMDLALRKFITAVKDEVTGEEKEVTTRIPQVDASALISETGTTAKYTHPKDPVLVHTTDVVTYTLRVYNEGSKDGYATQIKDDIPDGLEFLPDNETNKEYEWKLVDENDNVVTDISKAKYVVTNYLSKDNETDERQNLMKAFDLKTMTTPEYKDVKIAFKVVEPSTSDRILINYAQISEQTDGKGVHREDRDSVPNKWQGEDDEDIEKVRVQYFDLALRKWVTKAIVIQNGAENVTETGHHAEDDPEEVVKVDLKKSKIDSVVVKFEYQIRITNEGEIAGYAKEIKDHIPDGLRFEAADNQNWVQLDDKTIVTDELKDTLLQPGESAEVTVVLTWINSETNMGVKVNIAEISKDYNDYGTPDIDSTPDNEVPGEDDIDDAPVMLTVKTGANDLRYIGIALGVLAILGLGVSLIRDEVNKSRGKKSE